MTEVEFKINYHPVQEDIFSHPAKVKVIPKGRRFGLTKGYAHNCIESMLDGITPILWVDTVYTNINRYVERYFIPLLQQLPKEMWTWREQKKELVVNDCKLDLRSADRPELIEGFAYRKIYMNEAGIILKKRYLWENTIIPMMMDFDPDVYIGGTPKGLGLFHELYSKAVVSDNGWKAFQYATYDNPYLDKMVVDKLAAEMPDLVRKQEIYGEFIADAAGVFKNVDPCATAMDGKTYDVLNQYYMGVDLAKHVDYTVIVVMDENGEMVYFKRFKDYNWPTQRKIIKEVADTWHAKVLIDSTGIGDPIFDELDEMGLTCEGYKFTHDSKKKLVESLMISFEMEKIKIFRNEILINELKSFSYEISDSGLLKYSAPQGMHDDCVMSLALSNWCMDKSAIGPGVYTVNHNVY